MADANLERRLETLQNGLREMGKMCLQLGGDGQIADAVANAQAVASAVGNRRLVYVHGICKHVTGYSDRWWRALNLYVPNEFGQGRLGETRLEVIWSDIVNRPELEAGTQDGDRLAASPEELARAQFLDQTKQVIIDRANQYLMNSMAAECDEDGPPMETDGLWLVSIPDENCMDDFARYMSDSGVRRQIIGRFIDVVGPELGNGRELDIISHSWGTVVAYEGLRQLEDEGMPGRVRNFFTVGSALSQPMVKSNLRRQNQDGRKPANVRRWVNLHACGDAIGGTLKGWLPFPFHVNHEFLCLPPFGCGQFVSPACAHRSYFRVGNKKVNEDIFARFIHEA